MRWFGALLGLGIGALGAWRFDSTASKVAWVVGAVLITGLLLFVKRDGNREPLLRLTITVTLVLCAFAATLFGTDRPQLGLDLQGGVSIVLFPVDGSDLSQLDTAISVIQNRVNGLGVAEPEVSRQGNTIVVDIPGLKDPERAVAVVGRTACLRFRPVTDGPIPVAATVGTTAPTTSTTAAPSTTTTTAPGATSTTAGGTSTTTGETTTSTASSTASSGTDSSAGSAGATISTSPIVAARPVQESTSTSSAPSSTSPSSTTAGGGSSSTSAPDTTTSTVPAAPRLECDISKAASDPTIPTVPSVPGTTIPGPTTESSGPAISPTTPTSPGAPSDPTDATDASDPSADASAVSIATAPIAQRRPAQESTTSPTTVAGNSTSPTTAADDTTTSGATSTTIAPTTSTLPVGSNICESLVADDDPDGSVWLYDQQQENCYLVGPTVLTGRSIKDAGTRFDSEWLVDVEFRNDDFVTNVATPYVNTRVAIVLDDQVVSAPQINPNITGRDVQITGGPFIEKEARDLALVLRYGSLPVQFDESETTRVSVSPSLGKDQLRAGIIAGLIGLALVALYMIFFYRLLGFVVWLGLALTGLIFFTLVSFLGDASGLTLTLSGVTGLIVSVGVTVDSYVVYFERLKDEVRSGKTIRSSLDVGFTRAFRTIVAADLVSLIGAAVLYFLAIGSVKGFAFFLGLSTIIDLFIAYFFMYPMVWFLARRPALVRMRTMGIAAGLDVAGKVGV